MYGQPSPAKDLYVVEFTRHPGDLGVSLIVRADSALTARREAWRLFPEYKRVCLRTTVYLLDFAEIDWQSGQCVLMKRKNRPRVPIYVIDEYIPRILRAPKREPDGHESA